MSGGWKRACLAALGIPALIAGVALPSCGGDSTAKPDDGTACPPVCDDAGAAGEPPATPGGGSACPASPDAGEPHVPPDHIGFDGGVPFDEVSYAVAVARCNYWGRCLSFAPYVVSDCIAASTNGKAWSMGSCSGAPSNFFCYLTTVGVAFPTAALSQAIDAGVVKYDPQQQGACLEALQAEGCVGSAFRTGLPACATAFSCAPDAGTEDTGSSGGATPDGGVGCEALLPYGPSEIACATDADCTDAASGPDCVDGSCLPTPCGDADEVDCASFVGSGHTCDSDPPGFGGSLFVYEPTSLCTLGLTCKGLTLGTGDVPGTLGTCSTPQDIGGTCVQGATVTGCMKGLVCPCGICELPPNQGACVSDSCEVGVAYCDVLSGTCHPVKPLGSACATATNQCASDLVCDPTTRTCQPYQF